MPRRLVGLCRGGGIEKISSNLDCAGSPSMYLITPRHESRLKTKGSIFDRILARLRISLVTAATSVRALHKKVSTMTGFKVCGSWLIDENDKGIKFLPEATLSADTKIDSDFSLSVVRSSS